MSAADNHYTPGRNVGYVTAEYDALCPNGCGCRIGTADADRNDCACDGYCVADTSDWPAFSIEARATPPSLPVDERPCSVECCDAQERRHIHEGAPR